jgi:predicted dehydrogenase
MDLLIREFYASLQEKRPPPVTAEEGLRVMEVMDDVWARIGPGAVGPASAEHPPVR